MGEDPWLPKGSGFNVHIFYGQKGTFFKEKVTGGVMSLSGKYWARKLREAFFRGEEKEPDPCT